MSASALQGSKHLLYPMCVPVATELAASCSVSSTPAASPRDHVPAPAAPRSAAVPGALQTAAPSHSGATSGQLRHAAGTALSREGGRAGMMASGAQSSLQADLIAFDNPDAARHADAASRPADGIPDDACAHTHADKGDVHIAGADSQTAASDMPAASPLIQEIGSVRSSRLASASGVGDSVPHVAGPGDDETAHAADAVSASGAAAGVAASADSGKAPAGSPANADAVLASLEADDWDADDGCGFVTDPGDTTVGLQHEKGNRGIKSGPSTAPDAGAATSTVLALSPDCGARSF